MKYESIAGIDESGRGCLAGPLVVTAVMLPCAYSFTVKDSKMLTEAQRKRLYDQLLSSTPYISTCIVSTNAIDHSNILNATLNAMKTTILSLPSKTSTILIDGNQAPHLKGYDIQTVIKGDQKIPSISAASIIAKVTRDSIMSIYNLNYPNYQFQQNKGYGTEQHYAALFKYGPSPIHRKSFNLTKQLSLI